MIPPATDSTLNKKLPPRSKQLKLITALAQLDSAAQQAATASWSYSHFLGYLLEAELQERYRRTVKLNLQFAHFP
jgi:DNA replication protein DnaC